MSRGVEAIMKKQSEEPELKESVIKDIEEARKEMREGKTITTEQLLKELKIDPKDIYKETK